MMKLLPKPTHGSLEWLNQRWKVDGRAVFGASDAPVMMGASSYRSRADLYFDKMELPVVRETSPAMRRGNLLEPACLQFASEEMKIDLLTPEWQYQNGRFVISADGVDNADEPTVVVEAKTTARYSVDEASDLPMEWRWQGWAQQWVTGCPVFFVVLDRRQVFSLVELPQMHGALERLVEESELFGDIVDSQRGIEHLINEMSADDVSRAYSEVQGTVELDEDARLWIASLDIAREARSVAEAQEKQAKDALARLLKDAEVGTINGQSVVSWKQTMGRESLDTKRLKTEHPDLVAEYMKKGAPYRTMRLMKETKGE